MTITEFLLARIAEREQFAGALARVTYHSAEPDDARLLLPLIDLDLRAEMLAEGEAKRRIVVRCGEDQLSGIPALVHHANQTLHELASVYADHPDNDPAWRA